MGRVHYNQTDVARKAGVSQMTVSRYFVDDSYVSKKTRQKIKAAVKKLGYTPNPLARGLRASKTNTIGIIWSLGGPHRTSGMVRSIATGVQQQGYLPFVYDSRCDK